MRDGLLACLGVRVPVSELWSLPSHITSRGCLMRAPPPCSHASCKTAVPHMKIHHIFLRHALTLRTDPTTTSRTISEQIHKQYSSTHKCPSHLQPDSSQHPIRENCEPNVVFLSKQSLRCINVPMDNTIDSRTRCLHVPLPLSIHQTMAFVFVRQRIRHATHAF